MAANYEGWKLFKICTCGGVLKHKYKSITDTNRELHILPNRGKFRLLLNNKLIKEDLLTKINTIAANGT